MHPVWTVGRTPALRPVRLACLQRSFASAAVAGEGAKGPLHGIKVLDFSRVLAGPFCTQILADYGADVVKVEDTERGDDTRYWKSNGEESTWKSNAGPFSNYFAAINRNKRSIALNLKHEKARATVMKLVKDVDVVIDNFRTGVMDRLGIGYAELSKHNPGLIHASVSGYGAVGPYAQHAGYDLIAGAEGGLLHLTGPRNGPPTRPGLGLIDMSTGLFTHGAILSALYSRSTTGLGQKIDTSLFETQLALLSYVGLAWLNSGVETERWGTQHPTVVPYDAFKTKDLFLVCGAANDRQFQTLCTLLGLPELLEDDRFKTNADRIEHRDELLHPLSKVMETKSTAEWMTLFERSGLPHAPINDIGRVFQHPQVPATRMLQKVPFESAAAGEIHLIGPSVKFSDTQPTLRSLPPRLGEHTHEILKELAMSNDEIDAMYAERTASGPRSDAD